MSRASRAKRASLANRAGRLIKTGSGGSKLFDAHKRLK